MPSKNSKLSLHFIPAILIFISSYFPLVLILMVKDFDFESCRFHNAKIVLTLFFISIICCVVTIYSAKAIKSGIVISIKKVSNKSSDMFSYTIPYMISFYKFDFSDLNMVLSFLIFMILMFLISFRSQTLLINPILHFLGYGLYDCQFLHGDREENGLFLSKHELYREDKYVVQKLSNFLFIVTKGCFNKDDSNE